MSTSAYIRTTVMLLLLASISACGGGSGSQSNQSSVNAGNSGVIDSATGVNDQGAQGEVGDATVGSSGGGTGGSSGIAATGDGGFVTPSVTALRSNQFEYGEGRIVDAEIQIEGRAEPRSVIEVRLNGDLAGSTVVDSSGSWVLDYRSRSLTPGTYTVTVSTVTMDGTTVAGTATFQFIYDPSAPPAPVISQILAGGFPVLNGYAANGALLISGTGLAESTITLYYDGVAQGTALVAADGSWMLDLSQTTLPDGVYRLSADSNYRGLISAISPQTTLIIDSASPVAPIIDGVAPDSGVAGDEITNINQLLINGRAEAAATVTIFLDGSAIGTAVSASNSNWQLDYRGTALSDGTYQLTAVVTDAAGNQSSLSTPLALQIDTTAPSAPTIASINPDTGTAGDGVTNTGAISVTGSGEVGATIVLSDGGTALGSTVVASNGQWQLDLSATPLAAGAHTLSATATDVATNTSVQSASFSVVIDTAQPGAPRLLAINPDSGVAADLRTAATQLVFSGDQAVAGQAVEVFLNGSSIGQVTADGAGNWSLDHSATSLVNGVYAVTLQTWSNSGVASALSTAVNVTVDTVAPAAPVFSGFNPDSGLAGDNRTNVTAITLTGSGEVGAQVALSQGGTALGTAMVDGGGSWTFGVSNLTPDGTFNFTATQTDLVGNISTGSAPLSIQIDTTAPSAPAITGISPDTGIASDGITNTGAITVAGTGEAGATVTLSNGGSVIGSAVVAGNGQWQLDLSGTPLAAGTHTLAATATDVANNTSVSSATYSVTVDTVQPGAPQLQSINPDTGAVGDWRTSATQLIFSGNQGVANQPVEVFLNGSSIGQVTADAAGSWSLDYRSTSLVDGAYGVTLQTWSSSGVASALSASVTVTVDTLAPSAPGITGFSPDTGVLGDSRTSATAITLSGTSEAGAQVTVNQGGSLLGSTTADGAGNWSFAASGLTPDGTYSFTASQTDTAGNASAISGALAVNVDTSSPNLAATTPATSATGVGLDDTLALTLDEPAYVGTGTFAIRNSNGTLFEGVNVASAGITGAGSTTLAIDPVQSLVGGSVYYVGYDAGAFTDAAANGIAALTDVNVWRFTTEPTAILSSTPASGASGVALDASVVLNFNETVFVGSGDIILVRTSDSAEIERIAINGGQVSGFGSSQLTITWSDVYAPNTQYRVEVESGAVQNRNGVAFAGVSGAAAPVFTTANVATPVVQTVSAIQADGTYGRNDVVTLVVNFSESVNLSGSLALDIQLDSGPLTLAYSRGSGSAVLEFDYTVALGDAAADLSYVSSAALTLSSGTLRSTNLANADLTLPTPGAGGSLSGDRDIVIDAAGVIDLATWSAAQGFVVIGASNNAATGLTAALADINADGFDDVSTGGADQGYSVYGNSDVNRADVSLSGLATATGFSATTGTAADNSGHAVQAIGDVNGDGIDDWALAAPGDDSGGTNTGSVYVVYGQAGTRANLTNLNGLGAAEGFAIYGVEVGQLLAAGISGADQHGQTLAGRGDLNGDGLADLVIGHPGSDLDGADTGVVYVVYGQAGTRGAINLSAPGSEVLTIRPGTTGAGELGASVVYARDLNHDGFPDLVMGAPAGSAGGDVFVLFGSSVTRTGTFTLDTLNGNNGFRITSSEAGAGLGQAVASGDINADGLSDLVIGAVAEDNNGRLDNGTAAVIYGRNQVSGWATLNIDALALSAGYRIDGPVAGGFAGHQVAIASDYDGDGIGDIALSSWQNIGVGADAGAAWIVFGVAGTGRSDVDLAVLDPTEGLTVVAAAAGDELGRALATGDTNGDGLSDLSLGATGSDLGGNNSGAVYTLFGEDVRGSVTAGTSGTIGADSLVGTTGADTLVGNGGADSLAGGAGDDVLIVADDTFVRVNGGGGTDTLQLGAPQTLDLTTLEAERLSSIEVVDLGGSGSSLVISAQAVTQIAGQQPLVIQGNGSDSVVSTGDFWLNQGTTSSGGTTYDVYRMGNATIWVEVGVDLTGLTGFSGTQIIRFNAQSAGATAPVTNFPVLVRITDTTILNAVQPSAPDIRFVDADGTTVLNYEIVTWTSSYAEVWVRVPQIDATNSDFITLHYNDIVDGSVTSAEDAAAVWSGFTNAYHFAEASGTAFDSTGNANHAYASGTVSRTTRSQAATGNFARFANGSASLVVPYDPSFNVSGSAWSVALWMETDSCGTWNSSPLSAIRRGNSGTFWRFRGGYQDFIYGGHDIEFSINGTDFGDSYGSWADSTCESYMVATYNPAASTRLRIYSDGSQIFSSGSTFNVEALQDIVMGGHGDSGNVWIDEVRLTKTEFDANFVRLSYQNQRAGSGFISMP